MLQSTGFMANPMEDDGDSLWQGHWAIANIGLGGNAIKGPRWETTHFPCLLDQFTSMLDHGGGDQVCGLLLCEVGNWDHPLDEECRTRVSLLLNAAFVNSEARKYGKPNLVWPRGCEHGGETVVAWRGDMLFESMEPMPRARCRCHF